MRYPANWTQKQKDDLSRGFDAGNYGNAYESGDWFGWCDDNDFDEQTREFQIGAFLGFFSSYEIHEISDEIDTEQLKQLRAEFGDE